MEDPSARTGMGYGAATRHGGTLILSKSKRPIWEGHVLYDASIRLFGKGKTVETTTRSVVARGCRAGGGRTESEGFQGSESVLHGTTAADIRRHTFVQPDTTHVTERDVTPGTGVTPVGQR